MKAIETFYAGYKFRSRLEAKYAVFFTALLIGWEYEPEGYVLSSGVCYLPDFYLPTFNGGMWVEVKPREFTQEERDKCYLLCRESKKSVWLAVGHPDYRNYEVFYWNDNPPYVIRGDGIPNADQAEFENRMFGMTAYGKSGEMIPFEYRKLIGNSFKLAVRRAKHARFEFGEKE